MSYFLKSGGWAFNIQLPRLRSVILSIKVRVRTGTEQKCCIGKGLSFSIRLFQLLLICSESFTLRLSYQFC